MLTFKFQQYKMVATRKPNQEMNGKPRISTLDNRGKYEH